MSIDLNKVFDLSRNVFIEACAGAGKTWLLSKRYAAIIDDFARQQADNPQADLKDTSNILVITFTRKAAAEMSGRIYADLNQLIHDQALEHVPEHFGQHLRCAPPSYKMHLRSTYSRNAISTIDSFCTQILRDQAERLNIDPEFRIQDEADTQRMELETWEGFLRERSHNQDENLKLLLGHLSEYHLNHYVKKLQSHAQLMIGWLEYQANHSPETLQTEFKASHPLPKATGQVEQLLIELVDGLPDQAEMLDPDHEHYRNFADLVGFLSTPIEDDYQYGLELFEFVRRFVLLKDRSNFLKNPSIPSNVWPETWKNEIRTRLRLFKTEIEDLFSCETLMHEIPGKWDLEACTVQHHLAKFFLAYWEVLNKRLQREGVLSFNEVILQTRNLLLDPDIAAHYAKRYTHILFDEFQDTNDLRWDIIRLIAQGGQPILRKQGLFIVGDTKQSIYRFNQADVQVMNRVEKNIAESQGWTLTADETYRSSRKFVETIINPLISESFPSAAEKEDLELYETAFRETSAAKNSPLSEGQHAISRCVVSAVLEDENVRGTGVDIRHTADLTSDWLEWINEKQIPIGESPAIGILLRTFTHILEYIRIFTAKGLEFEVLSSKGLFKQQESFDIYHLLSILVNPLDDLALIGVLRSPIFVLTDAEIQELRELAGERVNSGWVFKGLLQTQTKIAETITSWQQEAAREPVDRLISNILAEGDRRLGWISETEGVLRLANLDRLIDMIHQLSLEGLGLREIQEYFKYQIQHGDASQAELPGAARIQILSIHRAKGLEFPVVILPDLQAPPKHETSGIFLGQINDQWQAGITLDSLHESHKTWMFEQIKTRTQAEELAEDKRLFYVALTRARYGVGFVARINPKRQPSSNTWWKRYLEPVFDLELDKEAVSRDPRAVQKAWQARSTPEVIYDLTVGSDLLVERVDLVEILDYEMKAPKPAPSPLIYEEISPHTIMTWMDKTTYTGSEERQRGDDLGLETSALTFGRLLHRAMEMEWFDLQSHTESIQLFLEDEGVLSSEDQQPFLDDLAACLAIYRESQLAKKLSGLAHKNKLAELPVFGYLQSESRVYKVSGVIDLLYQDGEEWVVLDYKSDKEMPQEAELKQYAYWYQIQTYLWILKLLYGIKARGELYFNRFDRFIRIEFEEDLYFSRLATLEQGHGLKPVLPTAAEPPRELQKILKRLGSQSETVLIEPTRNTAERITQSLAASGLNHPRLQILTSSECRKMTEPGGRRLTPYLTRLGVARLLGKKLHWGVVNRLAAAFYKATQGETVTISKVALYQSFLEWCDQQNILPPGKGEDLDQLSGELKVIIDSIHSTSVSDYRFFSTLADKRDVIFLDPLQGGRARSGFNMSSSDWTTQTDMPSKAAGHHYTPCFSTHEEVILVAAQISSLLQQGIAPAEIQIAVSSMERYVPAIVRVFGQVGISVRLSKREPVMERPVTQLALALIQGRVLHRLSWDQVMSVWLHPLVLPAGAVGNTRLKLDIEVRKLGFTMLDESLPEKLSHPRLNQAAKDLLNFVKKDWQGDQGAGLVKEADWLLKMLKDFQFTKRLEPGSVASKAYTSLKNAVVGIKNDWGRYLGRPGSMRDLKRELKERLKGVEVASVQQGFGVDVISLLDTLNLSSPHLFVMGLTEGQFPMTPDNNPYLQQSALNPWFLNLFLFKQWLKRPTGSLHLTAPLRNADGAALQESTFCQYLEKQHYPKIEMVSSEQQLHQMAGKKIIGPRSKHQIRHNELLQNAGRGQWYGELLPHGQKGFENISASAFDELIKCPQRYWYSRKLQLKPAETDIAERQEIEVGNLVHKLLENFGNEGGFLLVIKDLPTGLAKLEEVALSLLKEQEIDPEANLLDSKWNELYFKNIQDPQRNLLAAMLDREALVLKKFGDKGLHEQTFGFKEKEDSWPAFEIEGESLKLSLRGKIDRVFSAGNAVWATDYKTGVVELKDSQEFWTSQMLFYYLILKSHFPDKSVVLTYEQVKAFKKDAVGFKGYIGDLESDNPVLVTKPTRAKPFLPIAEHEAWSVERIKAETLNYAQYLADNAFPLTTRDEKKACAYCPYKRICRKTALPR
ncbi:MAG: UvrD-helicase domain-containing protein [Candidatus Marinimicrobia bacterium]|nr:UvrD-helicase domain-containing protein [Candidatus Neomarinimicrobiota bacterium]